MMDDSQRAMPKVLVAADLVSAINELLSMQEASERLATIAGMGLVRDPGKPDWCLGFGLYTKPLPNARFAVVGGLRLALVLSQTELNDLNGSVLVLGARGRIRVSRNPKKGEIARLQKRHGQLMPLSIA